MLPSISHFSTVPYRTAQYRSDSGRSERHLLLLPSFTERGKRRSRGSGYLQRDNLQQQYAHFILLTFNIPISSTQFFCRLDSAGYQSVIHFRKSCVTSSVRKRRRKKRNQYCRFTFALLNFQNKLSTELNPKRISNSNFAFYYR